MVIATTWVVIVVAQSFFLFSFLFLLDICFFFFFFFVYWFVDSPSWRDQTDPALHVKKKKKLFHAIRRFISYGNGPNESDRIFSFRESRPAHHTYIYISFPSLINRKQIPPLVLYTRRKRGMQDAHKSWLLFSFFWERFFATGYWLRLKHRRKKKKKRKKQQETTDLCLDTTQHTTTTTVSPSQLHQYPISPFFLPLFFISFRFYFFFSHSNIFSLCLGPLLFLSLVSYIKNNTPELRPGCQTRNPTNRYALH
jgi:hypothetical protein